MQLRLSTWNVNSIRSRLEQLLVWLKSTNPDVVLLQELKCVEEQFPLLELESLNYNVIFLGQKSYNGVAILSKYRLDNVAYELPLYGVVDGDNDARYIEASINIDSKLLRIASIYVPNGGPPANYEGDITETDRFHNKIKFYRRLHRLFGESLRNGDCAIYGGDFNVCPILEKDVYSVKKDGDITCNYKERREFQSFLDLGMHDIFREFNPNLMEYTWWGYRPWNMFEKNQGYRLDALLTTDNALPLVKECFVERNLRAQPKPSDHVPLTCILNV